MSRQVWVVGKIKDGQPHEWEFCGVFTTSQRAVAACTTPQHFVGPMRLNRRLPDKRISWKGAWYPIPRRA